ncbi:MAG TPA: peptidoglycan DD-metalloendopeptidase family protein [Casimicrobiaceae bacterium]|nr:peptidoglycan DD-metalloendopeptidase family protein [Casimicrobiaceae bacterium]
MAASKVEILAQSARGALGRGARAVVPRAGLALAGLAVLALSGVAAFGLAPDTALPPPPATTIVRPLPLPALVPQDEGTATAYRDEDHIRRGDTIGSALARLGVDDPQAIVFLTSDPSARPFYQLRPGQSLRVATRGDGTLLELRFVTAAGSLLTVARHGDALAATSVPAPVDVRWSMAAGEIRSSLFSAADDAGLPDAVTLQLADVFGAEIDFFKDLQRGDRFAVVYETRSVEGEPIGTGRIVAAQFENRGKTFQAFLFRDDDGSEGYYAADGAALRRAFLRSPMEFSRITSGFSNARFHPILQSWRAHRGVDYAAPVGTPVRATGNGVVAFAGQQTGYGNVVVLRHRGVFSTAYAHLSRFAPRLRNGARVAQGEVIGYVGQTGWATGPHLHYEFRVADVARNPLTVALPGGEPLPASRRAAFGARIEPAVAQLDVARRFGGAAFASR